MSQKFSEKLTIYKLMHYTIIMLCIMTVYFVTNLIVKEFNPDWFAYEKVFNNNGWIEDGDRDLGFLFLINIYKSIIKNDYDSFRLILSFLFILFTLFLVWGKIIQFDNYVVSPTAVLFAILALILIRFSIQIREGLSMVFVVFAFGNIFNQENYLSYKVYQNNINLSPTNIGLSNLLFICAFSIHAGTTVFLVLSIISLVLCYVEKIASNLFYISKAILFLIVFTIFCAIPFYYSKVVSDNEFFSDMVESSNNSNLTIGKIGYWLFYGFMIVVLRNKVKYFKNNYLQSNFGKTYIELLSNYFMFAIYTSILISLFLSVPNFILSAQIRLLNLIICLLLFLLAAKTRNTFFIVIFSLFILIDQARTVVEALLTFD